MLMISKANNDDPHEQTKEQFKQFLEEESVPMRRAFNQFVQRMLDDVTDAQIRSWIENKDLQGFLKYAADYVDEMSDVLPNSFVRAANREIADLSQPGKFGTGKLAIKFDPGASNAADFMESNRLRFIKDFTAAQKDTVRSAISDALRAGEGPVAAARRFRSAIGLTENQYQAVQTYQTMLENGSRNALDRALRDARFDRTIERTIANDDVLSAKQIERMVGRYTDNMLNYRAETIARTEAMRSINQAKQSVWEQIADQLGIKPTKVERIWIATMDDRTRESHADMNGQTVTGLDEPFISGNGEELLYPGDFDAPPEETINCRCTVVVRFPPAPRQVSKAFDPDEARDEKGRWTDDLYNYAGAPDVNAKLREGKEMSTGEKRQVASLDKLSEDVQYKDLYRAYDSEHPDVKSIHNLKVGQTFEDKGFMSTTSSKKALDRIKQDVDENGREVTDVIHIHNADKLKGIDVNKNLTDHPFKYQREVLVGRNTSLVKTGETKEDGITIHHMEPR